jgi:hypothetical protein
MLLVGSFFRLVANGGNMKSWEIGSDFLSASSKLAGSQKP